MNADFSLLTLITQASLPVQLVMLILVIASVVSWFMIVRKGVMLRRALSAAEAFENRFWSGADLVAMYTRISDRPGSMMGMESLFENGFKEFARLRKQQVRDPIAIVEGSQRAMRVSLAREMDHLETHLSFLATVGSTSPYVGLFGTVWGIMNAFRMLGNTQHATLATVAPGIAEALVATAIGLLAAIPAVIAYNRFSYDVERLSNRYDTFVEEFSSILQRQAHAPGAAPQRTS